MDTHHYSIGRKSYQKMTIIESNMNNNKKTFHVTFCTWNVFNLVIEDEVRFKGDLYNLNK